MFKKTIACVLAVLLLLSCAGCQTTGQPGTGKLHASQGDCWYFGFGRRQILPDENSPEPLYMGGYNTATEAEGVLDYCEARAVWLDTGDRGILIIGIDCVGLSSGSVAKIRASLADLPNCAGVHVYATHTHAGPDTLGLWGPLGVDGKNSQYMDALFRAAEEAGREAAANRKAGSLYFGQVATEDMFRDSRLPTITDETLYHLRFEASDGSAGLRMFFYGAHAEALRGANKLLSRDFPGLLCDQVTEATGDDTMFCPGAIGGLVMTKDFYPDTAEGENALKNLEVTAAKLTDYALSITPEQERPVSPELQISRTVFTVPLDNPAFLLYRFLGILDNKAVKAESATGYGVESELSVVMLGDIALTLLPCEIFPELVKGLLYGDANPFAKNPKQLSVIAREHGITQMLIVGLANDELGYVVPPSDFLLNKEAPYLNRTMDYKGEDHYEETNSVGPECAAKIAEAFEVTLQALELG